MWICLPGGVCHSPYPCKSNGEMLVQPGIRWYPPLSQPALPHSPSRNGGSSSPSGGSWTWVCVCVGRRIRGAHSAAVSGCGSSGSSSSAAGLTVSCGVSPCCGKCLVADVGRHAVRARRASPGWIVGCWWVLVVAWLDGTYIVGSPCVAHWPWVCSCVVLLGVLWFRCSCVCRFVGVWLALPGRLCCGCGGCWLVAGGSASCLLLRYTREFLLRRRLRVILGSCLFFLGRLGLFGFLRTARVDGFAAKFTSTPVVSICSR